jgi:hypothetical protein
MLKSKNLLEDKKATTETKEKERATPLRVETGPQGIISMDVHQII